MINADRIFLPSRLDATTAFQLALELPRHVGADAVIIDFAQLAAAEPFGMLFAGAVLRDFVKQRKGNRIRAEGVRGGDAVHEYLAHVGFFQWLGLPVGKAPGATAGGSNWMPITVLTRMEFQKRMRETLRPLGYVVQVESDRLARLVTQRNELKANAPLAYCFREVIRNVFEHAETDRCAVCAQKGSDGFVELAIVDAGRGIRHSLEEKHSIASDADALELALRPGVSRSISGDPDDPWGNSGFGLFVLSSLGKALGAFRIASGDAVLALGSHDTSRERTALSGTAIQLRIKPPRGANFAEFIESIVKQGEDAMGDTLSHRASGSTRLLGSDSKIFRK